MSTEIYLPVKPFIDRTGYIAVTGSFFGVAIITAAARAFVRIHHLKKVNVEDYLVLVAVAALIAETGLSFTLILTWYKIFAISKGKSQPPADLIQKIENVTEYALPIQILCWITIFSIKWSFLFYFKALTYRLRKMEVWWWIVLMVLVPTTVMTTLGPFIVCPHAGRSIFANCSPSPTFVSREHKFVYYTAASDIVTDVMLISIPVIILRKSSFDIRRKINIGAVLCLSLFMIAIALIRGISAGVLGSEDQTWAVFWVHVEASVSVIAVCPTAFRSLFLIKSSPKQTPAKKDPNRAPVSAVERFWRKTPSLASINVGAKLTGMRTAVRDNEQTQLEIKDNDGRPPSTTELQSIHSDLSFEATKQNIELTREPARAIT